MIQETTARADLIALVTAVQAEGASSQSQSFDERRN